MRVRHISKCREQGRFVTRRPNASEAGFTLIEVMISLALFAIVSVAGIALVDAVVRVEEQTAGRLDRLGQFQRAMFVISRDLEQMSAGSLQQIDGGVQFQRQGSTVYEGPRPIRYVAQSGRLFRRAGADQLLVDRIAEVRWSFFVPGAGWQSALPPGGPQAPAAPTGIAVEVQLEDATGLSGSLRRVVELPEAPPASLSTPILPVTAQ
jgi:general secretion pathway protein J